MRDGVPIIEVPVNGFVRIICSGIGNRVFVLGTGALVVDLKCMPNGKFRADEGFEYDMKDLKCFRVRSLGGIDRKFEIFVFLGSRKSFEVQKRRQ